MNVIARQQKKDIDLWQVQCYPVVNTPATPLAARPSAIGQVLFFTAAYWKGSMPFNKPPFAFSDQVKLLQSRGLVIANTQDKEPQKAIL